MHGAVPPVLKYVLLAWCLVKHRDNFSFTCENQEAGALYEYKISVGKPEEKTPLGRCRSKWDCNNEMVCEYVDLIHLAQVRVQW
jgi:hypothetical protein